MHDGLVGHRAALADGRAREDDGASDDDARVRDHLWQRDHRGEIVLGQAEGEAEFLAQIRVCDLGVDAHQRVHERLVTVGSQHAQRPAFEQRAIEPRVLQREALHTALRQRPGA